MRNEISLHMNPMSSNRDQEVRAEKGLEDHKGRDQNTGNDEEMHHVEWNFIPHESNELQQEPGGQGRLRVGWP